MATIKTPAYILDFTVSQMEKGKIEVSYFCGRVEANVELLLDGRALGLWLEENDLNVLVRDYEKEGRHIQETYELTGFEICETYLEDAHVIKYLTEKGLF